MVAGVYPAILCGESAMARLKKAPGRLIGRWKEEAIAANAGASDEQLAHIINETARRQGYNYTITPQKVRTRKKSKGRRAARRTAPTFAAPTNQEPAPKPTSMGGISLEDIRAVKELVNRIGADQLQELTGMLAR